MTVSTYVENVTIRSRVSASFLKDGTEICKLDGVEIPFSEIERLYPITGIIEPSGYKYKGENSNKSVNWMVGKKSY